MAVQTPTPQSRRAILAAALGAGAATIASALGRPLPAAAANGDAVTVGGTFAGTATTQISNGINSATVFEGISLLSGIGVAGTSSSGNGVQGVSSSSSSAAVLGRSLASKSGVQGFSGKGLADVPPAAVADTGVHGTASADLGTGVLGIGASTSTSNSVGVIGAGDTGVFGASGATGIGVYGSVSNSVAPSVYGSAGVIGQTDAGGTGVVGFTGLTEHVPPPDTGIYGRSDTGGAGGRGLTGFCATGIGLLGQSDTGEGVVAYCNTTTGNALRVSGKVAFSRSGKLTIAAGHSSLTKTGIALTSASFILATLQTNVAGLFVQAVVLNPAGSAFTIYLNKAPTVSVVVAWLAVN
jgi:hypothetical protein